MDNIILHAAPPQIGFTNGFRRMQPMACALRLAFFRPCAERDGRLTSFEQPPNGNPVRFSDHPDKECIVAVPLKQQIAVGAYIIEQRLIGRGLCPWSHARAAVSLQPRLRRLGKIDYLRPLDKRLSVEDYLDAVDEGVAAIVAIPGGEPLIHRKSSRSWRMVDFGQAQIRLAVHRCAAAREEAASVQPSPYLFFSSGLDGLRDAVAAPSAGRAWTGAVSAIRPPRPPASRSMPTPPFLR